MKTWLGDIRFGVRLLGKRPGFTLLAILALALGIGANSAVFSLVNAMLLRPLVMERPEELVGVYSKDIVNPDTYRAFSYPNYVDLRERSGVFSDLMAHNLSLVGLSEGDTTRRVFAEVVTADYFATLGAPLFQGRPFTKSEELPDSRIPVAIVSYNLWKNGGSDPGQIGKTIRVNGVVFTVVGIAAEGFTGTTALVSPDVWLPLGVWGQVRNDFQSDAGASLSDRANHALILVGRLKSGIEAPVAEQRLAAFASELAQAYPQENQNQTFTLHPLARLSVSTHPPDESGLTVVSFLLIGMSSVVLLIACLNLANMMLARGASRRKELAIRLAVGGSRFRVVRQLLTEGLLLALAGGAAGLLLAGAATKLLVASLQSIAPLTIVFSGGFDPRVLAATLGFAAASTLFFALGPALKLSRPNLVTELKESAGEDTAGAHLGFFNPRNLLVLSQIALSLMLLTTAGLFTRGAFRAGNLEPGFDLDNQLLVETDPGLIGHDETRGREIFRSLTERLEALPGVESVSPAATVPFGMVSLGKSVLPAEAGDPSDPKVRGRAVLATYNVVGPEYFSTLGIPLLRGRGFSQSEMEAGTPPVAVVDDALAEKLWPGEDPLGRRIKFVDAVPVNANPQATGTVESMEVVGVVAKVRDELFRRPEGGTHVYVPLGQDYQSDIHLHLRLAPTGADGAAALAEAVRGEIRSFDATLPILALKTMRVHLDASGELWILRTGARLFAVFGAVALFLAVVGLYGVRAYTVARRTREIGIRIALGASTGQALRLVLKEGLLLSLIGIAIGLGLAALAGQLVGGLLYEVTATDWITFVTAPAILLAVSLLACYLPARRASRVSPLVALRYE